MKRRGDAKGKRLFNPDHYPNGALPTVPDDYLAQNKDAALSTEGLVEAAIRERDRAGEKSVAVEWLLGRDDADERSHSAQATVSMANWIIDRFATTGANHSAAQRKNARAPRGKRTPLWAVRNSIARLGSDAPTLDIWNDLCCFKGDDEDELETTISEVSSRGRSILKWTWDRKYGEQRRGSWTRRAFETVVSRLRASHKAGRK